MKRERRRRYFRGLDELECFLADAANNGKALHVTVFHGERCTPTVCLCSPSFAVEALTIEAAKRGAEMQASWVRRAAS